MKWSERNEQVEVSFDRIIRMTDKAVLFEIEGSEEWLPKSQIDNLLDLEEQEMKEPGEVSIPRWLAEEHGWE